MYLKFRKQIVRNRTNGLPLGASNMISAWRVLDCPYNNYKSEIEQAKRFAIDLFMDIWKIPIEFQVHDIIYSADIGSSASMPYCFNSTRTTIEVNDFGANDREEYEEEEEEESEYDEDEGMVLTKIPKGTSESLKAYMQESRPHEYLLLSEKNKEEFLARSYSSKSKYLNSRPVLWAGQVYACILRLDLIGTGIKVTGDYLGPTDHSLYPDNYDTNLKCYIECPSTIYFASAPMMLDSIDFFRPELLNFYDQALLKSLDKGDYHYICNSNYCERTNKADTLKLQQFLSDHGLDEYSEANIQNPIVRPCTLERWMNTWGIDYLKGSFGYTPENVSIITQKKKTLLGALL